MKKKLHSLFYALLLVQPYCFSAEKAPEFECHKLVANKSFVVIMTPAGLVKHGHTHPIMTKDETVDCIVGMDKHNRRHLLMAAESSIKIHGQFTTVKVMEQDELQMLARIRGATFLVPSPDAPAQASRPQSKNNRVAQAKKSWNKFKNSLLPATRNQGKNNA